MNGETTADPTPLSPEPLSREPQSAKQERLALEAGTHVLAVDDFGNQYLAARSPADPSPEPLREVLNGLLNSLGIVGPKIRHAFDDGTDPKSPVPPVVLEDGSSWCVCGRPWPCEAKALGDLVGSLTLASQRSDGRGWSEHAAERQAPDPADLTAATPQRTD